MRACLLEHGFFNETDVLRQIACPVALRHGNRAGIGLFLSDNELEEGRFSRSVPAGKTDPLSRVHGKRDVIENGFFAE